MKVQGNRYINNPEMIKNKVEKKTTVPQNIISEDDVKISDSARKLVETARNKVSDFRPAIFQKPLTDFPNSLQTHFVLQKWKLLSNLI